MTEHLTERAHLTEPERSRLARAFSEGWYATTHAVEDIVRERLGQVPDIPTAPAAGVDRGCAGEHRPLPPMLSENPTPPGSGSDQ